MGTYHTISPFKGLMCSFTQNVAARLGLLVDEETRAKVRFCIPAADARYSPHNQNVKSTGSWSHSLF
jgi:hypothetical protein